MKSEWLILVFVVTAVFARPQEDTDPLAETGVDPGAQTLTEQSESPEDSSNSPNAASSPPSKSEVTFPLHDTPPDVLPGLHQLSLGSTLKMHRLRKDMHTDSFMDKMAGITANRTDSTEDEYSSDAKGGKPPTPPKE